MNDPRCIKEDVCDMAVCDGIESCGHAVLKTAVLAQQTNNRQSMPCMGCGSRRGVEPVDMCVMCREIACC